MSNATCAACGGSVNERERFVLAGSEVFHIGCISDIPRSRLHRAATRIREKKAQLDRMRFELEGAKEAQRRLQDAVDATHVRQTAALEWERQRYADAQAELVGARKQRDDALQALQSARAELAVQRALAPAPIRSDSNPDEKPDTRDPLEVRASLLELD